MNRFDNLVGYCEEKKKLLQIANILHDPKKYAQNGIGLPKGVLLIGDHASGKTAMADALIEESGRPCFFCADGDIMASFAQANDAAKKDAPVILFLDDLHRESEDFFQKLSFCFDCLDEDVMILGVVSDSDLLPGYLTNAHRFTWTVRLREPDEEGVKEAIDFFLHDDAPLFDRDAVTNLLSGYEYGEIKAVLNAAKLFCVESGAERLTTEHILQSFITLFYPYLDRKKSVRNEEFRRTAYHEAGHAVVSEVLFPESVSLVINRGKSGLTSYCANNRLSLYEETILRITRSLGGKAATKLCFGISDFGVENDMCRSFEGVRTCIVDCCSKGFENGKIGDGFESDRLKKRQERKITAEVRKRYRLAKRILRKNRDFLEKTAKALMEKEVLSAADIRAIRKTCKIKTVKVF